ncbi:MAG TPA: gamma-glutamyltransferase family protein [Quisquiliibacterium sp.]|nr:gamma-glutamyltransferase family protein [Quisquiliibacterium sp.]HQN13877.1 gamma-glutamyltransferase family protein [Quisquiliibacterium sp.]
MNPSTFDWNTGYPSIRIPVFARNVVATSQPLAAQAGLRMLYAGGNAIDATIAAAAAITIVEPVSCGLGSDAFAIVWDGNQLHGLNASGVAPAAWDRAYFERRHNGQIPMRGWDAVTVPGAVAGWAELHRRFGRLPFADVLQPAIELAERGYAVSPVLQQKWAAQVPVLCDQPGFAQAFMPHGRAPQVGERFEFAAAARTLRRIADTHGRDYYEGHVAEQLVAHARAHGGAMTLDDLRAYRPDWVGTIAKDYRGYTLHEIPPNGQGIAALMALGMLSHFDLPSLHPDSADARHLQIEAMKAAFADVYQYVGDIRHMTRVRPEDLLDDGYLAERARRIRLDRATEFRHGTPPTGGTIYLTAADEQGMMVSFIQSNYMGFGSGVVVPEVGVSLQNRGYGFSLDPVHQNCVAPGKRPFQTIIPAFLMRDGRPQMSFGVMGGNMQPQGHLQTLLRMIDWKQNPQAACDAPRWKVNRGLSVDVESAMQPDVVAELALRGHQLEAIDDPYMDFGSGQFIWRQSDAMENGRLVDGYVAASDSRRDGCAAGF